MNDLDFPAHLTAHAADLIRGLMHSDPAQRLGSEQALAHPWLAPDVERLNLQAAINPEGQDACES